jgi:glycosyltransferase involved in cell wall biosynthesis
MNSTVSIVMAYFNRKSQLMFTLQTINNTKYDKKLIDIIIVDDGSDIQHILDQNILKTQFNLNIRVIRIDKNMKSWINPCVAYNIGIKYAKGDILIYQNPECCHMGDIISYTVKNLKITDYFSYTCVALCSKNDNKILYDTSSLKDCRTTLYNHKEKLPRYFHFCGAIYRIQMNKLNGFNEYMKDGYWYDDDEILLRIQLLCKMQIIHEKEGILVVHQYHKSFVNGKNMEILKLNNKKIIDTLDKNNLLPNWKNNNL